MSLKRMINGNVVDIAGSGGGGGGGEVITLTQQEYDALSQSEKEDLTKVYYISDASPSGGVSTLAELNDTTISNPSNDQVLKYNSTSNKWVNGEVPAGGHTMSPTPAAGLTEAQVVAAINAALANNDNVASLFGIQKWSNVVTRRFIYNGTVGSTGIGEWQDELDNPSAADEAGWGWWYDDYFKSDEINANTDNLKIDIIYDTTPKEPIILGGWRMDTTNGYMCIKFANEIATPASAKVGVDITILRNEVS